MSWIAALKYIPDLIKLIRAISTAIRKGRTHLQIKRDFKAIEKAFKRKDLVRKAQGIDDVFNQKMQ